MKGRCAFSCLLLVSGCGPSAPAPAVINSIDIASGINVEELIRNTRGLTSTCVARIREIGIEAIEPLDQCFQMTPPRRQRGLWRAEFEGSRFCPAPAQSCVYETPGNEIWLTIGEHLPERRIEYRGQLYEIEFVGRQTAVAGAHGHLGGSDHEVIVDELISIREIEPPPPPPTQAELQAEWARCRAAKTCFSHGDFDNLLNTSD